MFFFVYGNDWWRHVGHVAKNNGKNSTELTPDGAQKLKDFIIQVNFFKQISHKVITLPKKSLKNWFPFSLFGKGAVGWFLNPKKIC